ncbi:unnamed protein product [Allacma fusca]|uniref:Endonuclease G, mitochondrial n=1 Tax=Allacma fusca TaxID=39272 RepID=A0A8J2JCH2_9HEXA|nr:unnamed protein product [Allacma fusca]
MSSEPSTNFQFLTRPYDQSDANTKKLRLRNSTKVAEERSDALPWPPPTESVPLTNGISVPTFAAIMGCQDKLSALAIGDERVLKKFSQVRYNCQLIDTSVSCVPATNCAATFPRYPMQGFVRPFREELQPINRGMFSFPGPSIPQLQRSTPSPVGVFWDIENCQIPRGRSALITVLRIREKFFTRFLEAEFVCVCDIRKESPVVIQELNDAQVNVVHVAGNSKNAADDKLRQAMRRFADVHTSIMPKDSTPATIILISGDINFASDLSDLRYRFVSGFSRKFQFLEVFPTGSEDFFKPERFERIVSKKRLYIILLHNKHAPEALLLCAHEHYDFHSLLGDLPYRSVIREDFDDFGRELPRKGGHFPMDVVVSELPLMKNVNKIKTRLKKLSDNCGGKVMSIQGQFAILRFPNKEAALSFQLATKRMNGEDVFGSKIRVLYSSQVEVSPVQQQQQQQSMVQLPQQPIIGIASMTGGPAMTAVSPQNIMQQYSSNNSQGKKKLGWKRSATAIEQSSHLDYSTLKKEVAALLQDVPNHSLPLFKFREMFERRYRRSVSSYDLYRMRDVVNISESSSYSSSSSASSSSTSGRNISLCHDWVHKQDDLVLFCKLHPPKLQGVDKCRTGWAEKEVTPPLPVVMIDLKTLATRVHSMLHSHNGSLPILSFLDCYEFAFGAIDLANEGNGVPLEHLITCVQGVEIGIAENGMKRVQWSEKSEVEVNALGIAQPQALQMTQLSRELIDLLKTFPRCCLPFAKLIPAYHHHFGRQCRVADYGHTTLSSLLKTLPSTIQVMGENQNRVLTLAHKAQMKRFATDVLRVLKAQGGPKKLIKVDEFAISFSQVFPTRTFAPEDYGLCYFSDLIQEQIENSALVALLKDDEGSNVLAIPKREQTPQEIHKTRIFATEVFDLLRHSIRCEMPFSKFIPAYHHHFGRQCRVADYGFSKLAELFEAITDTVVAVSPNNGISSSPDCSMDDKILRLTAREQFKVVGEQIWSLVEKRHKAGLMTVLDDLDELYLNEYGFLLRPDLCEADTIRDLVEKKLSQFIKVEQGDRLVLVDRAQVEQLVQDAKSILENQPECTMELDMFIQAFKTRFQKDIDLAVIQRDLSHIMMLTQDENDKYIISLAPLRVFAREIVELLDEIGGHILVANFETAYLHKFGRPVRPAQMGFPSLAGLLQSIPDVVTIRGTTRTKRAIYLNCSTAVTEKRHFTARSKFQSHVYSNTGSTNNSYHQGGSSAGQANSRVTNGVNSMGSHNQSRWSPKWRNNAVATPVLPPHLYSPTPQSPMYAQGHNQETSVFSFDRPTNQMSPPMYDMWMRDAATPASPPVSPPMVWTYHPVVYPAPTTSPAAPSSSVILPPHISFGSGPWSPPPAQMMMYEQRMPPNSVHPSLVSGNNPAGQTRLTNSFQRLKLHVKEVSHGISEIVKWCRPCRHSWDTWFRAAKSFGGGQEPGSGVVPIDDKNPNWNWSPENQKQFRVSQIMRYGFPGLENVRSYDDFVLSYDRRNRVPQWVFEHLTRESVAHNSSVDRSKCDFHEDTSIHQFFRSTNQDYKGSGYDRGHLAAAGNHRISQHHCEQTFVLSNMSPQVGRGFNRDSWNRLEKHVRGLTKHYKNVYVCTGPLYLPRLEADGKSYVHYQVIGKNNVAVPTHFFKVVVGEDQNGHVDLESYVMPNAPINDEVPLQAFQVPIESIERGAGLLLFDKINRSSFRAINGRKTSFF